MILVTDDFTSLTNGMRKTFPLSKAPISRTDIVAQNGVIQDSGYDRDYVVIQVENQGFVLWWTGDAPIRGDRLTIKYQTDIP
jgi:hypothetical protein